MVEAVTEDVALKQRVFRELDGILRRGTILASNTSSISLTKLAAATQRPELVIGMHFMHPVPAMQLVEIVRALQTSDETYETTCDLARRLGKTIVTTKDMPAFIVNRLLIPQLNEACFALTEGLGTVEEIDLAIRLGLNHPMGPFQLADLLGLDTVLTIAEVLQHEFGDDKYRPPTILRNYVAAGWLGRKSGPRLLSLPGRAQRARLGAQAEVSLRCGEGATNAGRGSPRSLLDPARDGVVAIR